MIPAVSVAPATAPRSRSATRLVSWTGDARAVATTFSALATQLSPGDLLVVNDSGTLPASLRGTDDEGNALEVRLLTSPDGDGAVNAVVFGAGDWRTKTEDRVPPPALSPGARLHLGSLEATVTALLDHPRLVTLRFAERGAPLFHALYTEGRPVQYAYLKAPLALWDVQNVYSGPAVSAELPSAGYAITFALLDELAARGVRVVALTHAAGLSSTGDPTLDARLPLPERYVIPEATAAAIRETRSRGGRVVAVGTSVVRALESAALAQKTDRIAGASATTALRIDARHRLAVVTGIVTGVHAPGESHYDLLEAFVPRAELDAAFSRAAALGLLGHEFGDAILLWSSRQ